MCSTSRPEGSRPLSAGCAASAEWIAGARLGFGLGGEYVRLLRSDAGALDTSFKAFTAGLTWYPRGLARIAEGGSR
jgi:hypothetical protein